MVEKPDKCLHALCRCPRPVGGDYCSDYCSLGMDDLDTACGCGHPECQAMLSALSGGADNRIEWREGRE
jgi:hypothetical protein